MLPHEPTSIQKTPDFVETIADIKRSIAPIVCAHIGSPDWTLDSIEGSAFFVNSECAFATAAHVIKGLQDRKGQKPCSISAIYIPEGGWTEKPTFRVNYTRFSADTCRVNEDFDVAICKPAVPIVATVAVVFDPNHQPEGMNVAFTGFPLSRVTPITAIGSIAGYADIKETGPLTVVLDANNWPGASGSPIYLKSGKVVGMVTKRGTGDGTGLAYDNTAQFISATILEAQQTKR